MKTYNVDIPVTTTILLEVEANNPEEAFEKAKQMIPEDAELLLDACARVSDEEAQLNFDFIV